MKNINDFTAGEIMSSHMITAFPDMIMTEVSKIFEKNTFHHLPVVNSEGVCVGVISKSDYLLLQDKFTKSKNNTYAEMRNKKLFRSLLASDVMSSDPKCVDTKDSVSTITAIFLENKIHSVVVNDNAKCVGIITPHDILKQLKETTHA